MTNTFTIAVTLSATVFARSLSLAPSERTSIVPTRTSVSTKCTESTALKAVPRLGDDFLEYLRFVHDDQDLQLEDVIARYSETTPMRKRPNQPSQRQLIEELNKMTERHQVWIQRQVQRTKSK